MKNYNNFKDSNSTFNETIEAMTKVAIDYNKAKKYQKNSHNPSKTDLRYGKNKLGVSSNIRNSLLEKWKKLASNLQEGYLQYISSEPSLKTIENLKKLKKGEFNKMNKDSIDFDYDFYQVMDAAYEGEYDGELGQFDLPKFEKTEELIEKIWNEKYNDIDSWLEIPWTKEEKDQIFESARNEAKLFDRMDIYNSRARYQSYDETRNVLKEVFGIDNKYLHDSKLGDNKVMKKISFKDTSADEIIDLINKAADEGRTYIWLLNRFPELLMYDKNYKTIFPTTYSNNTIYLTKPIHPIEKDKDKIMEMLPTLNKSLDEIHMILNKYPEQTDFWGLNYSKILKLKNETDSKSESYKIEDDWNSYNKNMTRIEKLLSEYFHIFEKDIIKIDKFTFDVLKDLYDSKDIFPSYKEEYKGRAIDIGKRGKVKHLTREQENYIRRVIANSKRDITEWSKTKDKRVEARHNSYENDPINISHKAKEDLKKLLSQLKDLTNEELPDDANNDVRHIINKLIGTYSMTTNDVYSVMKDLQTVLSNLPDYNEKINAKKEEIQKFMSDYKEKLKKSNKKMYLPDSIDKKRSHKRDAFVSAFTDKRVKDWKQVLHIYLEWEGIIGYDDIIISYLENDEYDELREFLSDEGIYGYYYTIVDIFETGEVNIPDMDEEDYERFF